ncbi:MAG TPA: phytanoyl-CoA dioxygenase family protein [Caldilineaceae bacterium]|nr:phytanoyl-CoA dioxygenase family protein [Caldilineaceae bacterium]
MTQVSTGDRVLSAEDRAFWEENGYVVIHNAVPQANLDAVINDIWEFLGVDRNDPEAWYRAPISKAGMLEMYHTQSLWDNRQYPRVHQAFADIWGTEALWVSFDRANMNPPARPDWDYQGMVHWDIDTSQNPIPFRVQGVLYLEDTAANQGGFQCVAGFHRRFAEWVKSQPADRDPWHPALEGLEVKTIPGKAGDLLIWHSLLPHGNSRNRSNKPRLAQYITMYPAREDNEEERQYRIRAWQERLPPRGKAFPGDPRGFEKNRPPAELTELGKKLLGLERWHA